MGGTFDPIHYGHLVTAEEALHQFDLDEVLFVPTGRPWMKAHEAVSPAEDRYLMTVIATASNPLFGVSRIEVDRDGPTYAVDTLRELRTERGDDTDLFFVTGADAVLEIVEQWKEPEELLALAHFIAATRPGFDLEAFEAHAPTEAPAHHRDEHPRARDLLDRRARPGAREPPDPLPGARGREELHREGGALPVSDQRAPGEPVRPSRVERASASRRRRGVVWGVVAALVVAAVGWYLVGRGDDPPAAADDTGADQPAPEASTLLALQVNGAPAPMLAVIGVPGDGEPFADAACRRSSPSRCLARARHRWRAWRRCPATRCGWRCRT